MREYLVEVYVPRNGAADVRRAAGRARATAQQLSDDGIAVRYVRAIFVSEDETCFHLFEASSPQAVRAASEQAGLRTQRMVETVGVPPVAIEPDGSMQ